jgi:hypothetical protein
MSRPWPGTPNGRLSPILTCWRSRELSGAPSSPITSAATTWPTVGTGASERIGGPSGQAANLSRAGRSHSVVPTLTPATSTPQAPPVMPAPPDA